MKYINCFHITIKNLNLTIKNLIIYNEIEKYRKYD